MRKVTLLIVLFISVTMSAQFKFGGIASVGVGSESTTIPMDSFNVRFGGGPLIEYGGFGYSIRTGAVFQSDSKKDSLNVKTPIVRLMIPLQFILKSNRQGGFVGVGVSIDVLRQDDMGGTYDFIVGNKVARNIDLSVGFSYPMKGGIQDALICLRMCMFPLSTCKEACGF